MHTESKTLRGLSYLFSRLPLPEKWLHFITITWVLFQLITSAGMHVSKTATVYHLTLIDHVHAYSGVGVFLFSVVFVITVINRRPLRDMYPWVYGNFSVIKEDIQALFKGHLAEPRPSGLAATVEGLGLLALLLAGFTGVLWLISMLTENSWSPDFLEIHKTAVGAIEAYIWGHGLFALFHLLLWWRKR